MVENGTFLYLSPADQRLGDNVVYNESIHDGTWRGN